MEVIINYLENHFTKTRARILVCLILMVVGYSNSQIKNKLGFDYKSLKKYRSALDKKEIDDLFSNGGARRKSKLDQYSEIIKKDFEGNPPSTLRAAKERIKKLTGEDISLNRLGIFLKKRA